VKGKYLKYQKKKTRLQLNSCDEAPRSITTGSYAKKRLFSLLQHRKTFLYTQQLYGCDEKFIITA